MYFGWKIPVLPEDLEELQECREVDNGVAESTGGANGRRRNPPALPEGSNRGRGVTGGTDRKSVV